MERNHWFEMEHGTCLYQNKVATCENTGEKLDIGWEGLSRHLPRGGLGLGRSKQRSRGERDAENEATPKDRSQKKRCHNPDNQSVSKEGYLVSERWYFSFLANSLFKVIGSLGWDD